MALFALPSTDAKFSSADFSLISIIAGIGGDSFLENAFHAQNILGVSVEPFLKHGS